MSILITNDVEITVAETLQKVGYSCPCTYVDGATARVLLCLDEGGFLQGDLSAEDLRRAFEVVKALLAEPQHPRNNVEQEAWRKARGIYLALLDEKGHRIGGFLTHTGNMHTTRG